MFQNRRKEETCSRSFSPALIMADATELARLLAELASSTNRGSDGGDALIGPPNSVSHLAASLSHSSCGTRVLDAALSLMCFKSPQVLSENVRWLVESIVVVLSSSVECKVVREARRERKGVEWLVVGSSIGSGDCGKLIRICLDVLERLDEHGSSHPLLRAVLRATGSAPRYHKLSPLSSLYYEKRESLSSGDERRLGSELSCILSEETSISSHELPLRLLLWYLNPFTLKDDISKILLDAMNRPYLHLKNEFHERMDWRFIIICMVTSPTIFIETRTLLHNWFLLTGLASILELLIAMVSSVLDVLSRPMWWGLTMEMGMKLPFCHAYFHNKHDDLLCVLNGSISYENFHDLVHLVGVSDALNDDLLNTSLLHHAERNAEAKLALVDSNSTWAMLLCFPCWFYFAAVLAFCGNISEQCVPPVFSSRLVNFEMENCIELCHAAIMYLSLILSPLDQSCQNHLSDCIKEMVRAWPGQAKANHASQQCYQLVARSKFSLSHSKKLKILESTSSEKLCMNIDGCNASNINFWLKKFHGNIAKFYDNDLAPCEASRNDPVNTWSNLLFTKIPVGILLASPNHFDDDSCEVLLHYAATGEVCELVDTQITRIDCMISRYTGASNSTGPTGSYAAADIVKWSLGASFVLNLIDNLTDLTYALFETEDTHIEYICQVKGKMVKYLVRCIRNILKLKEGDGKDAVLMDLLNKLMWWRRQGGENFEGYKSFNDLVHELKSMLALSDTI